MENEKTEISAVGQGLEGKTSVFVNPVPRSIPGAEGHTQVQPHQDADWARLESTEQIEPKRPPLIPVGYRIQALLGEGAFGEVWSGVQEGTEIHVAIKFFHAHTISNWRQLREETRKLAMLHAEAGVVCLIDVNENTSPPYFVMDFAEHGSLAARLQHGPLPVAEALTLFKKIVDAMAYVHVKGIRHCDIKPGNILLDAADRPRIADFGQAHLSIEATPSAQGTFFYMAPEQATFEKQIPDARWDVYGLGALFYAMLTGSPPRYDVACKAELEQTADLPKRLTRYRDWVYRVPEPKEHCKVAGMDKDLAAVVSRCLALDPGKRYSDAGALRAALRFREKSRRVKPLVRFAMAAPLVVMLIVGLLGYNGLNNSKTTITHDYNDKILQGDQILADLAVNVLRENMVESLAFVKQLANSDKLREALLAYRKHPTRENLAQLDDRFSNYDKFFKRRFSRYNLFDEKGVFLTGYRSDLAGKTQEMQDYIQELKDKNFSYRDYFNRMGEDQPPRQNATYAYRPHLINGVDEPYLGLPYRSTSSGHKILFPVSAPITHEADKGELIGVLLASLTLDEVGQWFAPIQKKGGNIVVVDRRGYCWFHRDEFAGNIQDQIPPLSGQGAEPSRPAFREIVEQALLPASARTEHWDPWERKTVLAAYAPVRDRDWLIVVQHDRDQISGEVEEIYGSLLQCFWATLTTSGILLTALWGWLLWILFKKGGIAHG